METTYRPRSCALEFCKVKIFSPSEMIDTFVGLTDGKPIPPPNEIERFNLFLMKFVRNFSDCWGMTFPVVDVEWHKRYNYVLKDEDWTILNTPAGDYETRYANGHLQAALVCLMPMMQAEIARKRKEYGMRNSPLVWKNVVERNCYAFCDKFTRYYRLAVDNKVDILPSYPEENIAEVKYKPKAPVPNQIVFRDEKKMCTLKDNFKVTKVFTQNEYRRFLKFVWYECDNKVEDFVEAVAFYLSRDYKCKYPAVKTARKGELGVIMDENPNNKYWNRKVDNSYCYGHLQAAIQMYWMMNPEKIKKAIEKHSIGNVQIKLLNPKGRAILYSIHDFHQNSETYEIKRVPYKDGIMSVNHHAVETRELDEDKIPEVKLKAKQNKSQFRPKSVKKTLKDPQVLKKAIEEEPSFQMLAPETTFAQFLEMERAKKMEKPAENMNEVMHVVESRFGEVESVSKVVAGAGKKRSRGMAMKIKTMPETQGLRVLMPCEIEEMVLPETQGNQNDLEEVESVSKNQNVTFVDERPVESDTAHVSKDLVLQDRHSDISESPWSIPQLLSREFLVATGDWTVDSPRVMAVLPFPKTLMTKGSVQVNQLKTCGFLRAGVEVRIVLNGNKFMIGRMLAHLEPVMFSGDQHLLDDENYVCMPHAFLDASVSNSVVLTLPFSHFYTYLPQRKGTIENDECCCIGRLVLSVWSQFVPNDGGTQRLNWSVYARFVNPELHQTVYEIEEFSYSDGFITQGLEEEMPEVQAGNEIINKSSSSTCHPGSSSGADILNLAGNIPGDDMQTTAGFGEMDLQKLMQIPCLTERVSWKTSQAPGTEIVSFPVAANYVSKMRVDVLLDGGVLITPTTLNYISRMCVYCDGDLELKIQVIGNAFMSGRLMHTFDPSWVAGTNTHVDMVNLSNVNCVIQDVQEQQEIKISIPFTSLRPLLRCDHWRVISNFAAGRDKLGQSAMGFFRTIVLNGLVAPAAITEEIEVLYYLYAGSNFRVSVPCSLSPLVPDPGPASRWYQGSEYPQIVGNTTPYLYDNRDYIWDVYWEGLKLYKANLIGNFTTPATWYKYKPIKAGLHSAEAMIWFRKVQQLSFYVEHLQGSQQAKLMSDMSDYTVHVQEGAVAEGLEEFVTGRKNNELVPIIMTKNNRPNKSRVMDAESLTMQSLIKRFYPLFIMRPKKVVGGFTLMKIPVRPNFTTTNMNPIAGQRAHSQVTNQLSWISNMFGFWEGSLVYRVVVPNTDAEVYIAYLPHDCYPFEIITGVDASEVQKQMAYSGTLGLTHLQGTWEVEVPFYSPYNQCMVEKNLQHFDLRCQNGTLYVYVRNKNAEDSETMASIFIAAGKGFKLNWFMGPPVIFDPEVNYLVQAGGLKTLEMTEAHCNLGDWGQTTISPLCAGYKDTQAQSELGIMENAPTMTEVERTGEIRLDDLAESQGLVGPFEAFASIKNAAGSIETAATRVANSIDFIAGNTDEVARSIAGASVGMSKGSEAIGSTAHTLEHYLNISASVLLVGNTIRSFVHVAQQPTNAGAWLDFGLSFAAVIGYNARQAIQDLVHKLMNWFKKDEQAQAEALNGAVHDVLEENETLITKCVAVLGTILYAYVFDCIPKWMNLRKLIQDFLEAEPPKTQGFDLRGAHFGYLGITALSKVFDNCVHYVKKFLDWVMEKESPDAILARKAGEHRERIMNLVKELDHFDNEYEVLKALQDPFVHNKFYLLAQEANDLTDIFMSGKMDRHVGQILTECRTRARDLVKRLEKEAPVHTWRYDPYVVCIWGESGTGKTAIMREVSDNIAEIIGAPEYNRVYNKNINDDFWSGYTQQTIVHWDEFGQNTKKDESVAEFIELRSNDPKRLNMAALEEKGRYFNSKAIVMTTNVAYHHFPTAIREKDAYLRRRHFMVQMHHKRGQDANFVQNLKGFDPDFKHCLFRRTDWKTKPSDHSGGWVSKDELIAQIRAEVKKWDAKQHQMYEEYVNTGLAGVMPRGVIPVVEEVEIDEDGNEVEPEPTAEQVEEAAASLRIDHEVENVPVAPEASAEDEIDPRAFMELAAMPNIVEVNETKNMCVVQGDENELKLPTESITTLNLLAHNSNWYNAAGTSNYKLDDNTNKYLKGRMNSLEPEYVNQTTFNVGNRLLKFKKKHHSMMGQCSGKIVKLRWIRDDKELLDPEQEYIARCFIARQEVVYTTWYGDMAKLTRDCVNYGKEKAVSFLSYAKNMFRMISAKIVSLVEKYPKLSIAIAALGTIGVVLTTMVTINQTAGVESKAQKTEVLQKDDETMWEVAPENKYDVNLKHAKVRMVKAEEAEFFMSKVPRAEGNEDQCAMDIRSVIHSNLIVIGWSKGSKKLTILRGLHLCGQILLTPYHFFHGAEEGDKFILGHRSVYVEFQKSKMYRPANKDWCLYDCGARFEPRRSVIKYFMDEASLGKNPKMKALLCNVTTEGTQTMMHGIAKAVENYQYRDPMFGEIYTQNGWETDFATQSGDCGSLLLALAPSLPPPGKVLGIHTAGFAKKSSGFAVLVTRQQLEEAMTHMVPQVMGMPVPTEVIRDATRINELRVIPEGNYSIYGIMPNKLSPAQPQKSSFEKTPFSEESLQSIPVTKKPAHLHPFLKDGEKFSPLKEAVNKYGHHTMPFPARNVEKAKQHLKTVLRNKLKGLRNRVFTEKEAIIGIPGLEFADRLNMKSSCGWPYQVLDKKNKGKFAMFDDDGNVINEELRTRLDERLAAARKGERVVSIWRDCMKDELRPLDKIAAGKTRLFTIAPVDYTILVRRYFMSFAMAFYENNCNFFSAVGINPESYEWTNLYNKLCRVGKKAVGLDYKTFDGKLFPELMAVAGEVINELLSELEAEGEEDPDANLIRKVFLNEMIHTMQLVENCVYATHQGNPSGNPLTVIINTLVNFLYLCLSWIEIYPELTLADFDEDVEAICYGDDVTYTVHEKRDKFGFNAVKNVLAKYGIEITADVKTKEDVPDFRPLDELTFLKRGFRRDEEFGNQFVLPTMAKETLWSYFHWVRKAEDYEEQLKENQKNALHFAAFHGRAFYEDYKRKWDECMKSASLESVGTTFEEQVDVFLYASRMFTDRGNERQAFDNMVEGCYTVATFEKAKKEPIAEDGPVWSVFWQALDFAKMGFAAWAAYQAIGIVRLAKIEVDCEKKNNFRLARWGGTDPRYAICLPSGEGKSTLGKKLPEVFVDHDEMIVDGDPNVGPCKFKRSWQQYQEEKMDLYKQGRKLEEMTDYERHEMAKSFPGWYFDWVRLRDKPMEDRRILLTHGPATTCRQILGCYILPKPTDIRNNAGGRRALQQHAKVLDFEPRDNEMLQLAFDVEPALFTEEVLKKITSLGYVEPRIENRIYKEPQKEKIEIENANIETTKVVT